MSYKKRLILDETIGGSQQYTLGAFYTRLRAQVEHENILYDQRMMWLVTLQAILFATMGFVIAGFLSKDVFDLESGLPQNAIIVPVLIFVGLICFAGIYAGMACRKTLRQAVQVTEEIDDMWRAQRRKIFEFEQMHLRGPNMTYEDAIGMFPHPRGGWKSDDVDEQLNRTKKNDFYRSRYIPLVFVYIWSLSLGVVLIGILLILTGTDPASFLKSTDESSALLHQEGCDIHRQLDCSTGADYVHHLS